METSMMEKVKDNDVIISDMYNKISNIILNNKNKMVYQINNTSCNSNCT